MKGKILVIEDEVGIQKIISDFLNQESMDVVLASDGQEGLDLFDETFDLVLLDIMMPKMDGWSVCRRIRKISDVPIIMLTARSDEDDELLGFELKANDYVKKPFSPAVLVARVKKQLENHQGHKQEEDILTYKDLVIDFKSRTVKVNNDLIDLTMKCFDILGLLARNENMVFSRDKILDEIWGYDYFGDSRVVDNHIKKLRKALADKAYYLVTVFGVGYKFEVKL